MIYLVMLSVVICLWFDIILLFFSAECVLTIDHERKNKKEVGSFHVFEDGGACVRAMMLIMKIEFDDIIIMMSTNIMM